MLAAYFDETYGSDRTITAVLGSVATANKWRLFERDWQKEMKPFGGGPFHHVEWQQRKKSYGRFKALAELGPKEVNAKERKLRWIIEQHVMRFVFETVIEAEYERQLVRRLSPDSRLYADSYHFCLFSCLAQIQPALPTAAFPLLSTRIVPLRADGAKETLSLELDSPRRSPAACSQAGNAVVRVRRFPECPQ